jgi:hypothetical protein
MSEPWGIASVSCPSALSAVAATSPAYAVLVLRISESPTRTSAQMQNSMVGVYLPASRMAMVEQRKSLPQAVPSSIWITSTLVESPLTVSKDLFSGSALKCTDVVTFRWAMGGSGCGTYVVAAEVVHGGLGKLLRVSQWSSRGGVRSRQVGTARRAPKLVCVFPSLSVEPV